MAANVLKKNREAGKSARKVVGTKKKQLEEHLVSNLGLVT